MNTQAKPFVQRGDAGQPKSSRQKPTVNAPAANAGSKQAGPPVCYECKQPGHICPDCPNLRGKSRIEETEQGDGVDHHPDVAQEDNPLVEDEWGHLPPDKDECLDGLDEEAPNPASNYEWDEEMNEGETPSFQANALSTPE